MKDFLAVFSYTFNEHLKKKAFIVSTIIVILLTIVILLVPAAINALSKPEGSNNSDITSSGADSTKNQGTFYVIDKDNFFKGDIGLLRSSFLTYTFELSAPETEDSLLDEVKNGKDLYLLTIGNNQGIPAALYSVKEYGKGPSPDQLTAVIKTMYYKELLKSANVSDDITAKLLLPVNVTVNELGKGFVNSQISCMAIIMLLFFSIYYYGYWIAMSVASEKTSRVMEILITSTKPSSIILGKTAAMGLLGLSQLILILTTGFTTYKLAFPKDFKLLGQSIDFSSFTPFSIFMIVIYFILGYLLYAMLNAVAGATVSKAEDVNSAIMPISMISLVSFYLAYMPAVIPTGDKISAIASIVPFSAAFSMPGRLLTRDVPSWEIALSILLLVASIFLFVTISVKLYSSAILHYGKRLKISELVKMARK